MDPAVRPDQLDLVVALDEGAGGADSREAGLKYKSALTNGRQGLPEKNTEIHMQSFIEQLTELLELDDPSELTGETKLATIEMWDSLSQLSFIVFVDETYGKDITGEQLMACETISDLYGLTQ